MTLQNIYMAYGGMNWGHSAAPVVYTSYDYSAPLRETRQLWDKMSQTKLIGLFTRASSWSKGGLLGVEMHGNGTGHAVSTPDIWTWQLRNKNTGADFFITQHANSRSRDTTKLEMYLETSAAGNVTVSDVSLFGRRSRIVVTDFVLAGGKMLAWCISDIAAYF